jgi:hypothetical protein
MLRLYLIYCAVSVSLSIPLGLLIGYLFFVPQEITVPAVIIESPTIPEKLKTWI